MNKYQYSDFPLQLWASTSSLLRQFCIGTRDQHQPIRFAWKQSKKEQTRGVRMKNIRRWWSEECSPGRARGQGTVWSGLLPSSERIAALRPLLLPEVWQRSATASARLHPRRRRSPCALARNSTSARLRSRAPKGVCTKKPRIRYKSTNIFPCLYIHACKCEYNRNRLFWTTCS